jgi:hypothetical protein
MVEDPTMQSKHWVQSSRYTDCAGVGGWSSGRYCKSQPYRRYRHNVITCGVNMRASHYGKVPFPVFEKIMKMHSEVSRCNVSGRVLIYTNVERFDHKTPLPCARVRVTLVYGCPFLKQNPTKRRSFILAFKFIHIHATHLSLSVLLKH